jgi:SAM-dependent methyltransferase
MIRAATRDPRIDYIVADHRLPIRTNSFSAVFCGNVFPEFNNIGDIRDSCIEIGRVLRPGGKFIVQTLNPDSIGCDYLSYSYLPVDRPVSGSPLTCVIKAEPPIYVRDYFWTVDDYQSALEAAGFKINRIVFPTANEDMQESPWLDETRTAADVLFECF